MRGASAATTRPPTLEDHFRNEPGPEFALVLPPEGEKRFTPDVTKEPSRSSALSSEQKAMAAMLTTEAVPL